MAFRPRFTFQPPAKPPIVILSTATPSDGAYQRNDSSPKKSCHYCVPGGYGVGSNGCSSVGGSFRTCLRAAEGFKSVVVGSTPKDRGDPPRGVRLVSKGPEAGRKRPTYRFLEVVREGMSLGAERPEAAESICSDVTRRAKSAESPPEKERAPR